MAEIRKHNPEGGDGIGELVRRALGETIRPTTPGERVAQAGDARDKAAADEDAPRADGLPNWPSEGFSITF